MNLEWNVFHQMLNEDHDKNISEENKKLKEAFDYLLGKDPLTPLGMVNKKYNETQKSFNYIISEYDMKNDKIGIH